MRKSRVGRNKGASAICDRTGVRYPMSEMVKEPGTGYLVHRSVSDGQWSAVSHPLNNLGRYLKNKQGDPFPVKNARPRPSTETVSLIASKTGTVNIGAIYYIPKIFTNITASVSISSSASLTVDTETLSEISFGSGSSSSSSSVTVEGLGVFSGSTDISSSSTVVSDGEELLLGTASISGQASISVDALGEFLGTSAITASASLTAPDPLWVETASQGDVGNPSSPNVVALSSTRIAQVDFSGDLLTLDNGGSSWTQTGSTLTGLFVSGSVYPIAKLDTNRIAIISTSDYASYNLQAYNFNGSTWSTTGSAYTVTVVGGLLPICSMGTNEIAYYDGDVLYKLSFNGSTWSVDGSTDITTSGGREITRLTDTRVALLDDTDDLIRVFDFSGSSWSAGGTQDLSSYAPSAGTLLDTLSDNRVVYFSGTTDNDLIIYEYDGSSWSQIDDVFDITTFGFASNSDLAVTASTEIIEFSSFIIRTIEYQGGL